MEPTQSFYPLIDNEFLVEANEIYIEHQYYHKELVRTLNIFKAAIHDAHNPDEPALIEEIKKDYATEKEFHAILPFYIKGGDLYETLTEKQATILFMYLCEGKKLSEIAAYFSISSPGVLKTIKLIQKKAKKIFGANYLSRGK